uniref:Uncharacterized protein n=1 Tax=Anguilla anguilla TaxID=7936 RepID=A0A0E9USM2_ANGAN
MSIQGPSVRSVPDTKTQRKRRPSSAHAPKPNPTI